MSNYKEVDTYKKGQICIPEYLLFVALIIKLTLPLSLFNGYCILLLTCKISNGCKVIFQLIFF